VADHCCVLKDLSDDGSITYGLGAGARVTANRETLPYTDGYGRPFEYERRSRTEHHESSMAARRVAPMERILDFHCNR
jgi:hypothetical protein